MTQIRQSAISSGKRCETNRTDYSGAERGWGVVQRKVTNRDNEQAGAVDDFSPANICGVPYCVTGIKDSLGRGEQSDNFEQNRSPYPYKAHTL